LAGEVDGELTVGRHPPVLDAGEPLQWYADVVDASGEKIGGRHHFERQVNADAFDHGVAGRRVGRGQRLQFLRHSGLGDAAV
jgi:hypothetical protein